MNNLQPYYIIEYCDDLIWGQFGRCIIKSLGEARKIVVSNKKVYPYYKFRILEFKAKIIEVTE